MELRLVCTYIHLLGNSVITIIDIIIFDFNKKFTNISLCIYDKW